MLNQVMHKSLWFGFRIFAEVNRNPKNTPKKFLRQQKLLEISLEPINVTDGKPIHLQGAGKEGLRMH